MTEAHCVTHKGQHFKECLMNRTHLKEALGTQWHEGETMLLAKD